ncbi:hypothetical protein ACFP2F_10195 [Hymenobacter artigasi]|uniref:Uncharacterized protein n=1 Tax=Hymenobacter artigasi TaxID=2719616 RepID=A0ABX1HJA8_9BACT|nr:hypothetical protein [Hymenobacter artigasi]NKI90361.1 hypothetical protein [Hymenobacter artigasi]
MSSVVKLRFLSGLLLKLAVPAAVLGQHDCPAFSAPRPALRAPHPAPPPVGAALCHKPCHS